MTVLGVLAGWPAPRVERCTAAWSSQRSCSQAMLTSMICASAGHRVGIMIHAAHRDHATTEDQADVHDPSCRWKLCWCPQNHAEVMIRGTASCYGQGSFFRSGIDDHKLITENESHWSPLWQPLTHSGKRNSPDKPLLKRILKIYATDAEMWFFTVDSLWRGERGCGKWRGKDSSFL